MTADEFLYYLQFDADKTRPPDWEIDWIDAPLTYKLYRGLPTVSLSAEIPLSLEGIDASEKPDINKIGHFLWYVYGLTQISQSAFILDSSVEELSVMQSFRRFVPSGGGLYPNELYIYLKLYTIPVGIYHYDVAHHRLVLLREGEYDTYIQRGLGNDCVMSACFGAVFVTTMFWKNFYKYNNFAYRLQGLDAGVLIGQLLEVAKRFGIDTKVYFQYLDKAFNHLLGLSGREETVYTVIPLTVDSRISFVANRGSDQITVSSNELCREILPVHHSHFERSKKIKEFPMLTAINDASLLDSTRSFRQGIEAKYYYSKDQTLSLPDVTRLSYDFASACRTRFSPDTDFMMGEVTLTQIALLLHETMSSFSFRNDVDRFEQEADPRLSLWCCVNNIKGIPDGAYYYDNSSHTLRLIRQGDHRFMLQQGMPMDNVNLFQVPLCFHIVGDRKHYIPTIGYRGYRIQQMEAGMLVQRLLLAASALGIGGHPLLGYDAALCDNIYNLKKFGLTSLIQVPVGPYRPRAKLEGALRS